MLGTTSAIKENSTLAKQVQIVSRNVRPNGYVFYVVKSSKGDTTKYATTLHNGVATACTCPSKAGHCYHRTQLETEEKKYNRPARKPRVKIVSPLVAELQLPEGKKVRLTKDGLKVSSSAPTNATQATPECPQDDELNAEEEALFQQIGNEEIVLADEIKVVDEWAERAAKAPLNGNRDFSKVLLFR